MQSLDLISFLQILSRLLDGSKLHQFKATFGSSLITGFARVKSHLVGVLANDGELSADAATKGTHFARLCTLRGIPMLFFVNTPPDPTYLSPTGNDGKTAKARAQMMAAIATSSTPKITIVLGGCYGPSALAMVGLVNTHTNTSYKILFRLQRSWNCYFNFFFC